MIIPQKNDYVKLLNLKDKKWSQKRAQAVAMSQKLYKVPHLRNRAGRMAFCSKITHSYICQKCGYPHIKTDGYCRDRLCPLCAWRLSMTKYAQMLEVIDVLSSKFDEGLYASMLTLTLRNTPLSDLRATLENMTRAWSAMRHYDCFKLIEGWARNIEITYNPAQKTYHPHMHVLLFWQGVENPDLVAARIVKAWEAQLHIDYRTIWHHTLAYLKEQELSDTQTEAEAAAREAAMYTLTSSTLLTIPQSDIAQFADAINYIRMTAYGGIVKKIRASLKLRDNVIDDERTEHELAKCPKCGGEMLHLVREWNSDNECYEIIGGDI